MLTLHKEVAALSRADCLDGLKRIIPPSRIKRVLRDSGKDRAFCPRLSPLSVVRFVLGLGLFCRDCYRQVFRWINPYSDVPGRSTLCEARQRVGVKPLVDLARQTVRLLAEPATTPGAFYRGMRLVALDGFVLDVPDSPDNARVFGRPQGGRTPGAFPQVRVVALCEVGTHVLFRWLSKPITIDERPMAERLMRELSSDMLLMWDRNFLSYNRVRQILGRGANLLAKIKKNLIFQPVMNIGVLFGHEVIIRMPKAGDRLFKRQIKSRHVLTHGSENVIAILEIDIFFRVFHHCLEIGKHGQLIGFFFETPRIL